MSFRTVTSCALMAALLMTSTGEAASRADRKEILVTHGGAEQRRGPRRIDLSVEETDTMARRALVRELRRKTEHCIFLSGGASKISPEQQKKLLGLMRALTVLSDRGTSFLVGDGGTQAGIMQAAGEARAAARHPFPLVGIAPAPNLEGASFEGVETYPADPNHSHLVAVLDAAWPAKQADYGWEPSWGYWGSETETMYEIFADLARDRASVTIVANGGGITLDEVAQNMRQGRRMVVIKGSGRAADAICCLVEGTEPEDEEVAKRMEKARKIGVPDHKELFALFDLNAGPEVLADVLAVLLEGARAR